MSADSDKRPLSQDAGYPTGDHLRAYWTRTDESGTGVIQVPDAAEPVIVEWTKYRYRRQEHYLAVFSHGTSRLLVRERYQHTVVTPEGAYRRQFRHRGQDGVCATELVRALAAGRALELERIEHGAYKGLWRADITRRRAQKERGTRVQACRLILNLDRHMATLVRWYYRDRRPTG